MLRYTLPIDAHLETINKQLQSCSSLVLCATPGSGKTTRVPPALLKNCKNKIVVLEPRRLAARTACERIAEENGWSVGQEVGYQVRFENQTSRSTRLIFMTEGVLLRQLQDNPFLDEIDMVILDEFHERSWYTDFAIAQLKELQNSIRPDLKIIIMSATLDPQPLLEFLPNSIFVNCPGQIFPVEQILQKHAQYLQPCPELYDNIISLLKIILTKNSEDHGHILIFLPGTGEIRDLFSRLTTLFSQNLLPKNCTIHQLYGTLSLNEQRQVLNPTVQTKIILSTNIAETSLTIDGVRTVIDSGLARVSGLNESGINTLHLQRISRFSAIQRAGRAGRQGPGLCYRLWNKQDELSMRDSEIPEILRMDLSEPLLYLFSQGITKPLEFGWFERPNSELLESGTLLLKYLEAITEDCRLTPIGKKMLNLPLPVRLARIMLAAEELNEIYTGAWICALLAQNSKASRSPSTNHNESDPIDELESSLSSTPTFTKTYKQILFSVNAKPQNDHTKPIFNDDAAKKLLLFGFPDRVCKRRSPRSRQARMVGGLGVTLSHSSRVTAADLFLAIQLQANTSKTNSSGVGATSKEVTVHSASSIEDTWLSEFFAHHLHNSSEVTFNPEDQTMWKTRSRNFIDLPIQLLSKERARPEESQHALTLVLKKQFPLFLQKQENLKNWLARIEFLRPLQPELEWPSLNPAPEDLLEEICYLENSLQKIFDKDALMYFAQRLPGELQRILDTQAPAHLSLPSGRTVKIDYTAPLPFFEARLQETYTLKETPLIGFGKMRIQAHLLAPNMRPIQVTSDLETFWKSSYFEIRKELRGRYPKHNWPEDPLNATNEMVKKR